MKNRYLLNELNFIEEAARELAGYDDASLLKEMEDAELEWELEKQRNPAKTREIMKSAEQGFSLLMARLQKEMVADGSLETEGKGECRKDTAESADDTESAEDQAGDKTPAGDKPAENRPVPYVRTGRMADHEGNAGCKAEGEGYTAAEADGEGDRRCRTDGGASGIIPPGECRMRVAADAGKMDIMDQVPRENVCRTAETLFIKPIAIRKKTLRRVVILVVAVMTLGLGSFASVARQGYQMVEYPEKNGAGVTVVRSNDKINIRESEIEEAYRKIGEIWDIKVLAFEYIPKNMEFERFIVADNKGIIVFLYKDNKVFLEEKKLSEKAAISALSMDRKTGEPIQNDWINEEIYLEENKLKNGAIEYSVQFQKDLAVYYLSGIMDKDEFIRIAESLYFWN